MRFRCSFFSGVSFVPGVLLGGGFDVLSLGGGRPKCQAFGVCFVCINIAAGVCPSASVPLVSVRLGLHSDAHKKTMANGKILFEMRRRRHVGER